MKNYIFILLMALSACNTLQNAPKAPAADDISSAVSLKQFKRDTLQYVQKKFIDNKQKYIGKNLSSLLKDLEVPLKSYSNGTSFVNPKITPYTRLEFYRTDQVSKKLDRPDKPVDIIITWSPSLPKDSVSILWNKTRGEWTADAKQYYSKQIVGDIQTTQYDK